MGPPFSLSEKVEAAIGLCNLKTNDQQLKAAPQYNTDLAAYVLANTVYEFVTAYNNDFVVFKAAPTKGKDDTHVVPRLPWKYYAARLDKGLEDMAANLTGPAAKKVVDLRGSSGGGASALLTTVSKMQQQVEMTPLLPNFIASIRPASAEVYKGSKEFVLPLAEK